MKQNKQQYDLVFSSSVAVIALQFEGVDLIRLQYLSQKESKLTTNGVAISVKDKLENYLNQRSKTLDIDVKLSVTSFQEKVLKQLQRIPYGKTKTYGEIAKILKTSPRAVGNACRNNPIPIIIPCHRVISATGIGGYSGETSGDLLGIKYQLLKLEGAY